MAEIPTVKRIPPKKLQPSNLLPLLSSGFTGVLGEVAEVDALVVVVDVTVVVDVVVLVVVDVEVVVELKYE